MESFVHVRGRHDFLLSLNQHRPENTKLFTLKKQMQIEKGKRLK